MTINEEPLGLNDLGDQRKRSEIISVCVIDLNVKRLHAEGIDAKIELTKSGAKLIAQFAGTGDLFNKECVEELKERFGEEEVELALCRATALVNKHLLVSLMTR